ncbi:MAG: long-chain fatty acid--CoA ligase [Bacteriovoracaceae bacterium]|nr:long-chain fatty acid--CoA ligase [Bacteriovoracaceae bacterium]
MSTLNTIGRLLVNRKNISAASPAYGHFKNNKILRYNFQAYYDTIELLAIGLQKMGLKPQNKVSLLSKTRAEWHLLDMAIMCSNAVTVPIYHSYTTAEIIELYQHSDSNVLIVENIKELHRLADALKKRCDFIITIKNFTVLEKEQFSEFNILSFQELLIFGSENLEESKVKFLEIINQQNPSDVATIIYTSGTTGIPKGAVITQGALTATLIGIKQFVGNAFNDKDRSLIFLPLSHVAGRIDSLLALIFGWEMIFAKSMDKIFENILLARPTVIIAVPRIFEKVYSAVIKQVEDQNVLKRKYFDWACEVSEKYFKQLEAGKSPSSLDILQQKIAYKTVFSKVNQYFGENIRYLITGGAPIEKEILSFLKYSNLTTLESYGLTETCGPCFINPPHLQKIGSVGKTFGKTKVKIASDGEICLQSDTLFKEYYKNPHETANAFDDGWFRTGDVGHLDRDNFLYITDRKKDLIITSAGKNIAPQKIENLLKTKSLISHVVICGDRKKYLTALIAIEKERFVPYLSSLNLPLDCKISDLANHSQVREMVGQQINEVNAGLANFESIKSFSILPFEITPENYQTPSLKIKKKQLLSDFQATIDKMY